MAFSWRAIFSLRKTKIDDPIAARRGFSISGGIYVNEDTAMKVSAFYRGATYIATQVAKLPWNIKDKNNEIQEDAISTLLNVAPNPEMTAMNWKIWAVLRAITHGNSFSEIERDRLGRPVNIWPITAPVDLVRDVNGKLFYRTASEVTGDIYLDPKDVFHVKNFHTKDGLYGQGVVSYAIDTLGISLGADRMAKNLFQNGGIPSGVLTHPGTLSDESYERLKKSWIENNGGENSSGVALLEEGMKFEAMNMDPQVLQFLDSRKFGVIEIARFLGLPPTKLFDMATSTYSNVENANLEVATDTLDAWVVNLELEADVKLLNRRFAGRYSEIDLYAVFRGDMSSRSTYFKNMMSVGAITPNQIREKEGMSPYPEGDKYYIATNNYTPADKVDDVIDAQIKSKQPTPGEKKPKEDTPDVTNALVNYLTKK